MKTEDLEIIRGDTFVFPVYWEDTDFVFKAISAVTNTAPVKITTAVAHTLKNRWRAAVVSVQGCKGINAEDPQKLRDSDFHEVTVVDTTNIELNKVNGAEFTAYVSGGYLQFYKPVDLTGFTARMSIKDKRGDAGVELLRLDTTNLGISIDVANNVITLNVSATATADIAWKRGVYDLELVSASGVVTKIMSGSVSVAQEATTV